MKKKFFLLFLTIISVICLAFGISACEDKSNSGQSNSSSEQTQIDNNSTESENSDTSNTEQSVNTYSLTYTAATGGYISGETLQTVNEDENGTDVTAVADIGYIFIGWSDGITTVTRTDENVKANIFVIAQFELQTFTVTYTAATGGSINGEVSQTVSYGSNGTSITAVADTGYTFTSWSDGVTTATRTDENVIENISVTAQFELQTFTITYMATTGGTIRGETLQTVTYGGNGFLVTAVAEDGYEFMGWSDGFKSYYRQDSNITSNMNVTALFDETDTINFAGGNGTESNPYRISTAEHLSNIKLYSSACYVLINDITLTTVVDGENNFTSLFNEETMFTGTLNGNGYTIYNLTIYNINTYYAGLFACIGSGGVVKNLTLENVNISGTNYIGGIAAYSLGDITDCTVTGNITYITQNNYGIYIGAIAGRAESDLINNCTTEIIIKAENISGTSYIGGIVGYYKISSVSETTTHSSNVEITVSGDDIAASIGGLYGRLYYGSISGSFSSGKILVYVNSGFIGGLVGEHITYGLGSEINNCHSGITINTENMSGEVGGLFGYCESDIIDCYYNGNISIVNSSSLLFAGGLIGYMADYFLITNSYCVGDIIITAKNYVQAGGLIGFGSPTITNSYVTSKITIISNGETLYVGGFIGNCINGFTINNSYTTSDMIISFNSGTLRVGGLAGNVSGNITIINSHWLYYSDDAAVYAVGYSDSLGIPTNMGATKHTEIIDFYTLAATLNSDGDTIWENKDSTSLPTLIN